VTGTRPAHSHEEEPDVELQDSADEARFRTEVRSWLGAALATLPLPEPPDLAAKLPRWRQWQRVLHEAGYAGLSWPVEYGGRGLDARLRAVFQEETDRVGVPEPLNILGENLAGPTIIDFGTAAQKRRFLEPILTGEEIWCQLFSESEAGSDLASLRTRATRVTGGWNVDGEKIWTSRAQLASNAIMLARTGGPRHAGITYFLLPLDSPGVSVRPVPHMLGEPEFNQVRLEDVFVPDELVVGEVDGGWRVAMATLGYERVALATGRVNTLGVVENLIADIATRTGRDGRPLGSDPLVRQRVGDLYGRVLTHRLIGQRVVGALADGEPPGPATSIGKLFFCPLVEDLADFGLSLDPLGGQFGTEDPVSGMPRSLRLAYQARGTSIAGGSTFIQRNIVSERLLGLPRG
jgi:alkylation response protein AidB-like acyl-CoA dehydrogenase